MAQYIQHPKIAKDFANYLELYGKYQTDYQIEEILKGNPDQVYCATTSRSAIFPIFSYT